MDTIAVIVEFDRGALTMPRLSPRPRNVGSPVRRGGCALALALLPALAAAAGAGADDSARCAALVGRTVAPDTVIESASFAPAGTTVTGTSVSVPFCRVLGVASPTQDSHIGFEVWLPPAASWNGNFRGEGSGASAGAISPVPMGEALQAGYATMSSDNGHLNDPNDPLGASAQHWAYGHPQKMIDWGWRALHLSTVGAKAIVHRYYGRDARENYFVGCSAGGHHAIMEATRFPQDYDGVVAGAAPWKWTSLMLGHTWNSIPALKDASALTAESVAILNRHMVAACDKLDGVEDGIIADPRRCTIDPEQFQCSARNRSDCLTAPQVAAARHIYAGATQSDGTRLMPGQVRGTELGWVPLMNGPHPGGSSWEFWRFSVFQDPDFRNADFDFDRDTARALATTVAGSTLAAVYDETPNFDAFRARGGRLILYQGWADYQISPLMDVDFYDRIVARYGQAATDDFLRFFMLPGMGHCSGGVGFSHIGAATGKALQDDDAHDLVRALDAWVRARKAPAMFVAAHENDHHELTATRPICRYPLEARYSGHGDTREAASFTCGLAAEAAPR
jgi:feruloyl esterase